MVIRNLLVRKKKLESLQFLIFQQFPVRLNMKYYVLKYFFIKEDKLVYIKTQICF